MTDHLVEIDLLTIKMLIFAKSKYKGPGKM